MESAIIITICVLLILAYAFDITASKTKIPSVVLLLALGYLVNHIADLFYIYIPDLSGVLSILGTVGLILIVLEGSLELELNRSKLPFVGKTAIMALFPMLLFAFALAWVLEYYTGAPFKIGLANAIPLAVISSAIAIPSVHGLMSKNREFITYESSLSDIFGVIFFNFITLNAYIGSDSFKNFTGQILLILLVSFVATMLLSFLLSRIKHHVKFAPIILMIVLIYAVAKLYHLPALIFILLFGLFMGNLDLLKENKFIHFFRPEILDKEVHKFKELTAEIAFLIRSLFFLVFGFLIEAHELLNPETLIWSLGITAGVFVIRFIFLKILGLNTMPIGMIAPRGLITILLFLSIPLTQTIPLVNKSLIIQVIVFTALFMMLGLMLHRKNKEVKTDNPVEDNQGGIQDEEE